MPQGNRTSMPRAHALQQQKPLQEEARTPQLESSPCLEKAHEQQRKLRTAIKSKQTKKPLDFLTYDQARNDHRASKEIQPPVTSPGLFHQVKWTSECPYASSHFIETKNSLSDSPAASSPCFAGCQYLALLCPSMCVAHIKH